MQGNLSLIEQTMLNAEDRQWWINRLNKHFEEQNKKQTTQQPMSDMPPLPDYPQ